jgi:hypothetical protein
MIASFGWCSLKAVLSLPTGPPTVKVGETRGGETQWSEELVENRKRTAMFGGTSTTHPHYVTQAYSKAL